MAEDDRIPYTRNILSRKYQQPPERVKNQFANDGSFLEMFKKRIMEEQLKKTTKKVDPDHQISSDLNNSISSTTVTTTEVTSTSNDDKIPLSPAGLSSDNLSNIINTKATSTTTVTPTSTTNTSNPLKSGLLPLVGKRRSDLRRSLKTGIVKKLKSDTSDTDNSLMNASTKYMEEVKRYKATLCVEDEKSRPLVK